MVKNDARMPDRFCCIFILFALVNDAYSICTDNAEVVGAEPSEWIPVGVLEELASNRGADASASIKKELSGEIRC